MMSDNIQGNVPEDEQILQWDEGLRAWNYTVCYHSTCEVKVILILLSKFREYNPDYTALVAKTNRTISVTANCASYPITEGQNGTDPNITFYNATAREARVIQDVSVST